jgi:outer membrane protein OmpA-like peptidoglycan-associated protein
VLRLTILMIVIVNAACGGGHSSEPPTSVADTSSSGQEATPREGTPDDSSGPKEFDLQASDTAGQARGARPSEIKPSAMEAAMRLIVVDPDAGPITGIVIKMTAPDGTSYYTEETDSEGYAEVLVPVGQKYEIEYLSLGRRNVTANVDVPASPNQNIRLTLRFRSERGRRPGADGEPQRVVLEGILFDTAKSTIRGESFPRLDRVVEYMKHRPRTRIRVAGHTDNVGNPQKNRTLSEARAKAVRDYIVSHGIDRSRVEAVGYGDQQPVATNDTEEGRSQNRRIEAVEL